MGGTCGPHVGEYVFTGFQMGKFERMRPLGNS